MTKRNLLMWLPMTLAVFALGLALYQRSNIEEPEPAPQLKLVQLYWFDGAIDKIRGYCIGVEGGSFHFIAIDDPKGDAWTPMMNKAFVVCTPIDDDFEVPPDPLIPSVKVL